MKKRKKKRKKRCHVKEIHYPKMTSNDLDTLPKNLKILLKKKLRKKKKSDLSAARLSTANTKL